MAAYRYSVVHVSLISNLGGRVLNWCKREDLRARMSKTLIFGKVKDPELILLHFRNNCSTGWGENERVPSRPIRSSGT